MKCSNVIPTNGRNLFPGQVEGFLAPKTPLGPVPRYRGNDNCKLLVKDNLRLMNNARNFSSAFLRVTPRVLRVTPRNYACACATYCVTFIDQEVNNDTYF
jgi:hypothetical protein